jgi:hypothetical protein
MIYSESEKKMREIRRHLIFMNKRPIEWIVSNSVFTGLIDGLCYIDNMESLTFEGVSLKKFESFNDNVICVVTENSVR